MNFRDFLDAAKVILAWAFGIALVIAIGVYSVSREIEIWSN